MRILYICTGNSFRSPAAEALTREFHPDYDVESAGTNAVGFISGPAIDFLRNHGAIQYVKPEPDQISQRAIDEADKIVCMMPEHRDYLMENFEADDSKIEVWEVRDGILPEVDPEESMQKILEKVKSL